MLDETPLLRSPRLPPLRATTPQNNSKPHCTATSFFLSNIPTRYWSQAQMLLSSLAVSFHIFEKTAFTSHGADVAGVLRALYFNFDLSKKRVRLPKTAASSPKSSSTIYRMSMSNDPHQHSSACSLLLRPPFPIS